MKKQNQGFTLLELLAGLVIVTIGLSTALPSYLRNVKQGDVDRYTQQLEAGFFSLRAQLGQQKTSCTLNFDSYGLSTFLPPSELIEINSNPELLECCDSDIGGCAYSPQIPSTIISQYDNQNASLSANDISKIQRERILRLIEIEQSPESKKVEVAVNTATYELTPPGTSTMSNNLIFLVRSNHENRARLRTRCLEISGTGTIFRGSWDEENYKCER